MSRVFCKIAGIKAADEGLEVAGCAMASDAFFPFRDGIDAAALAGVTCYSTWWFNRMMKIAANEHNIAMIFTNMRHFVINKVLI